MVNRHFSSCKFLFYLFLFNRNIENILHHAKHFNDEIPKISIYQDGGLHTSKQKSFQTLQNEWKKTSMFRVCDSFLIINLPSCWSSASMWSLTSSPSAPDIVQHPSIISVFTALLLQKKTRYILYVTNCYKV